MVWRQETQYKFLNVLDNVYRVFREVIDYTVSIRNPFGFILFYATGIIGFSLVLPISFILFNVLHGIDLFFITVLEKTTKGLNEDSPNWIQFISVTIALTFILPIIAFYTPSIIYYHFKDKRDAKIEQKRVNLERARLQAEGDLARWTRPTTDLTRFLRTDFVRVNKDFKPKKNIKAHNFTEHKVRSITPGVYITERDHVIINRRGRIIR